MAHPGYSSYGGVCDEALVTDTGSWKMVHAHGSPTEEQISDCSHINI